MARISEQDILTALKGVQDPDLKKDLVDLGMIKDVRVDAASLSLTVDLTTPACPLKDEIAKSVKAAITKHHPSLREIQVNFTSSRAGVKSVATDLLPGVRHVLLIGSGKGGVGKSTVSTNVAVSLALSGARVGLMDADVYGPSLPTILAVTERPGATREQRIIPVEKYGMKLMSMGMLLEEGQPVVWRGPMLDGIMRQFLGQVEWGELDYLVVDLPPGTGDVQLSLAALVPGALAVVVTTPQDVALADVRRAVNMFAKVNVQVLGIVENMSGFVCPSCGAHTDIFLKGGGRRAAEHFGVEFFGEIPLADGVARLTDEGLPPVMEEPDSPVGVALREISGRIARQVAITQAARAQRPASAPSPTAPQATAPTPTPAPSTGYMRL